jgi:hypothetical protein
LELIGKEAIRFPWLIKRSVGVVMGNGGAFPDSFVDDEEWEIYHDEEQLQ